MRTSGETARILAWECIGCGRIEGAQPCVGICEDRRAEFVHGSDYDEALAQLALARQQSEYLAGLVRQFAFTAPRAGQYEQTWLALQQRARRALEVDGGSAGATRTAVCSVKRPAG